MKKIMLSLLIAFGLSSCSLGDDIQDTCGAYEDVSFTGFPLLCNYSVKTMPNNATALIVNSQEKLEVNFTKHENTCTVPSDPAIDFTKNYLIGIYAGAKPTSGYAIKMSSIVENNCQIVINYYEKSPLPNEVITDGTTYPTDFILIPKTSKTIYFNKTTQSANTMIVGNYSSVCAGGGCLNFFQINDYNTIEFKNVVLNQYNFSQYKNTTTGKVGDYTLFLKSVPAEILNLKGQTKTYGAPDSSDQGGVYFELRQDGNTTKIYIDNKDTADQSVEIKAFKKAIQDKITALKKYSSS
nr:protease complex subunit PrcB family protein [uncultured Flavobacterium sp.]